MKKWILLSIVGVLLIALVIASVTLWMNKEKYDNLLLSITAPDYIGKPASENPHAFNYEGQLKKSIPLGETSGQFKYAGWNGPSESLYLAQPSTCHY